MPSNVSNNKRIAKNTILLYFRQIVCMIVGLYTMRVVLDVLGTENYGIYNIVGSIIILFSFLNNGLSNATKRYITSEIAVGTDESRQDVFNVAVIAHMIIAAIILVVAETIGLWAVNYFLNIPQERMLAANVVYQFSVFAALIGIMQSPFLSAIIAHEKMEVYAYITIFDVIFRLLIVFLVQALTGDKLIIYSILLFCVYILNVIIYRIYCYKTFKMCKWKKVRNKQLLKKIFSYTSWSLFGQGAVVASNQGVAMLINIFYNVSVNAAMGISTSVTRIVNEFVTNFQQAFNPQITKSYVNKNFSDLTDLVWKTSRYSSYLVLVFLLPVCFEVEDLLNIWLVDVPDYSVEFCVLSIISVYFEAITAPLWMVLCSDTDIKKYQLTISAIFMLNLVLSWAFLKLGCAPYIVTAVRIFVNVVLIVARLFLVRAKLAGFNIFKWLYDVFGKSVLIIALPLIVTIVLCRLDYSYIWIRLLMVSGISFLLTLLSIWILGIKKSERDFLINIVKNRVLHK